MSRRPDPGGAAAATPGARSFGRGDLEEREGGFVLRAGDGALEVGRDLVGASGRRALAAAAEVARALGVAESDLREFVAG